MTAAIVSLLVLLATTGCLAEAPSRTSAEIASEGYRMLYNALLSFEESNSKSPTHFHDETLCQVNCNGHLLTSPECIGRTEINCLSVTVPDADNTEERVDLYTRVCEGKFQNETRSQGRKFDTSQACSGYTKLTMRSELKKGEGYVVDFSYEKTCSTRFAMTVITIKDEGESPEEVEVATLCEGATMTMVDEEPSKTTARNTKERAKATCNGTPTTWDDPCDGVFNAKEYVDDVECDTTCKGKWRPYLVNWECRGEYKFSRYQITKTGYNARDRKCTGSAVVSASDYEVGYILCNGEDQFNERYSIPYTVET